MLKNESKILNEFFMKDLTKLIEKYNKMDEVTVGRLEDLVAKVDDNEIKESLMKDLDATLALVDELGEEVEDDVIQLYFFIKNNINEINIIEAKAIYEEMSNHSRWSRKFTRGSSDCQGQELAKYEGYLCWKRFDIIQHKLFDKI